MTRGAGCVNSRGCNPWNPGAASDKSAPRPNADSNPTERTDMTKRTKRLIMAATVCVALCWFCDLYYWVVDIIENRIPFEQNWGMEG